MDLRSIGNRVRSLRLGSGLSMKGLAEKITEQTGVTISSGQISDWENGYKNPSAPGLVALSLFFQVSTDWILKGSDTPDEQIELVRQFQQLPQQDQAFVKRYLQLALQDKEMSLYARSPSGRSLRRFRTVPTQKLPAVREVHQTYMLIQPQDSYEPDDPVAIRTADGIAVEQFRNVQASSVLGKVISEAVPPSE